MLRIRAGTSNFPNSLYDSGLKKRRVIGLLLIGVMLALFLAFNRVPKLDTVQADLAVATSPVAECFQGFCIEDQPEKSFMSRWWEFSLTYLQLVTVGMIFAFLVAGATEAFIFPKSAGWSLSGTGIKGALKGLLIGPAVNLCSACIVPVASAFRRRGSGIETTLAITQSSSTFNVPSLVMAAMVFAPLIGGTRIAVSLVGVLLIGPLVAKILKQDDDGLFDLPYSPTAPDMAGWRETIEESFREWAKITAGHVIRLAPVMVLAGFASGFAIQWLSPETVTTWLGDDVLGVVIAATIGIAINVPLLFEIPLVAVLLMAGYGDRARGGLAVHRSRGRADNLLGTVQGHAKESDCSVWRKYVAVGSCWRPGGAAVRLTWERAGLWTARRLWNIVTLHATSFGRGAGERGRVGKLDAVHGRYPLVGRYSYSHGAGTPVGQDRTQGHGRGRGSGRLRRRWLDRPVCPARRRSAQRTVHERGDGTFSEEAALRGADLPTRHGVAAAAADYDNDGDIDIVVSAQQAPHYLLVNDGSGRFSVNDTTLTEPKMFATSPSWGDVDNDGDLELALGEWNPETAKNYDAATKADNDIPEIANENPLIGGDDLSPLFVYGNDGQGRLEPYEFRATPGIDLWVFAPRFADLDGDGLTDLAVVSDYGLSRIYRNVGNGKFQLERGASPTFTDENGMGSAIGDYDNDGDLDWFVSSIFGQNNPDKGVFGGTGNRFYRNESEMRFADLSAEAGIRDGGWGWAASFGDLDNDGDLDLYHVNGWVQRAEEGSPEEFNNQTARLFENGGYLGFHEVGEQAGAADRGQGRGVILFDFDNDGDLDIFITNNHEYTMDGAEPVRRPAQPTLLRNDTQVGNHWLKVTLDGSPPLHSHGIGSRVYVTANGLTQMRELHASTNFVTQGPGRIAHFGLGSAGTVDEIRVEWVNGETSVLTNVPADQHIAIPSQ